MSCLTRAPSCAAWLPPADQHQIVHRLAVTFRGTERVNTGKPVSTAATQEVKQAQRALKKLLGQYRQTGKRPPASVWNATLNRVLQAQLPAVQRRRETAVTEATLTYSGIGQP